MPWMLFASFAAALLLSGGCGPVRPMTESEFKGFCYQYPGNPESGCDSISICNDYLTVIGVTQPSKATCLEKCAEVYRPQAMAHVLRGCSTAAANAESWCERYCRTAYSK